MNIKFKKTLLGLGGIALGVVPALALVSCGDTSGTNTDKIIYNPDGTIKNNITNSQEIIFGSSAEGTLLGLQEYFAIPAAIKLADQAAIEKYKGLQNLTLNHSEMKNMLFPASDFSSFPELVVNSVKQAYIHEGYHINNFGELINTQFGYNVAGRTIGVLNSSNLSSSEKTYYENKANWMASPTGSVVEIQQKTEIINLKRTLKNLKEKSSILISYEQFQLSKLGLITNPWIEIEILLSGTTQSESIFINENNELVLSVLNIDQAVIGQGKMLSFIEKLTPEKFANVALLSPEELKEYKDIFRSMTSANFIKTEPLKIAPNTSPIIKTIKLKDTTTSMATFNAKTIQEKLNLLIITFDENLIAPEIETTFISLIENITATANPTVNANWDLAITWNKNNFTTTKYETFDQTNDLPVGLVLYRNILLKLNDISTTSSKYTIVL